MKAEYDVAMEKYNKENGTKPEKVPKSEKSPKTTKTAKTDNKKTEKSKDSDKKVTFSVLRISKNKSLKIRSKDKKVRIAKSSEAKKE